MNDRKQLVINKAHQLFIEKGFLSTSIQDILDFSGISKGTFYNYFSSKNELLMAIFKSIFLRMERERDQLLHEADRSDPEVFIKQLNTHMKFYKEHNLVPLFEELFFSKDQELKEFLEIGQLKTIRWNYERLKEIVEESKHPYLLDAAIMLKGIMQQNIRYYAKAQGPSADLLPVIRFSVRRMMAMVEEAAHSEERLILPETMEKWLPSKNVEDLEFRNKLYSVISRLKKLNMNECDFIEKLDFIQEELSSAKPRKFLIDSILFSLTDVPEKELYDIKKLAESRLVHPS